MSPEYHGKVNNPMKCYLVAPKDGMLLLNSIEFLGGRTKNY